MWFTRISIGNPVMATMVMLAFVVLGLFSYQRLSVDQFPNIDFPTVVITVDYPGASPEIVESEVTKKVEEAVNTVAGIDTMFSRSYEGSSVTVVQFNLDIDGRKAAEDVREKVALLRPLLNDDVQEPRVSRFDPASTPIFDVAVLSPDDSRSPQELTTWADQVLVKRMQNVRGVGSVSIIGGVERRIQVRMNPAALEAQGVGVDQVLAALRSENQELPLGNLRANEQERVVQVNARIQRPEDFAGIVVARRNGVAIKLGQVAEIVDGPQEIESLALYNGRRTVLLSVQKSQGENTIAVVDGLQKALAEATAYVELGVMPGRDRLPREAAHFGTPVVLLCRGAAYCWDDFPLEAKYRVSDEPGWAAQTAAALQEVVANPQRAIDEQQPFRDWVAGDKERFGSEVDRWLDVALKK
jgi:HAE1 family hydrophobic/amphiphilic exporter-1